MSSLQTSRAAGNIATRRQAHGVAAVVGHLSWIAVRRRRYRRRRALAGARLRNNARVTLLGVDRCCATQGPSWSTNGRLHWTAVSEGGDSIKPTTR